MHRSSWLPCCVELRGSTSTSPLIPPSRRAVHRLLTPASRSCCSTEVGHVILSRSPPDPHRGFSAAVTLPFGRHRVLLPPVHPLVPTGTLATDSHRASLLHMVHHRGSPSQGPAETSSDPHDILLRCPHHGSTRCDHPVRSTVVGSTIFDSVVYPST